MNTHTQNFMKNDLYKGVHPIPNTKVLDLLHDIDYSEWLTKDSDWMYDTYKDVFYQWITSSKLNKLEGIENFKYKNYSFGTTQTFDLFYLQNKNRRFRFLKGDFFYHTVCNSNWEYLDVNTLDKNDAVILSVPFSDTGGIHDNFEEILSKCDKLKIPVLVDMCYYVMGKNININLNHDCIDTISFSLSKFAEGLQNFRCGFRLTKEFKDDGVNVVNEHNHVPKLSCGVGITIMDNFSVDYNWNEFGDSYNTICKQKNLTPTNTIIFGLGGSEYEYLNRGNYTNRVCISHDIWNLYNE